MHSKILTHKIIPGLFACTVLLSACSKSTPAETMVTSPTIETVGSVYADPVLSEVPISLTKDKNGTILLHGKETSEYFYGISDVEIVWSDGSATEFSTADAMRDYWADMPDWYTGYTEAPLTDGKQDGGIQLADINFDGYTDIGLQAQVTAYNQPYVYWFYSPETGDFQYHGNYICPLEPDAKHKKCILDYHDGQDRYTDYYIVDETHHLILSQRDVIQFIEGIPVHHTEYFTDESMADSRAWESIRAGSWQEAYRKVIQSDRNNLLADPDHIRSLVEGTWVYIGIHDFEEDGTPELVFGDCVSLAVFTYSNGCIKKIQDICFPGTVWCVNGVCFQGNALRAECNGSGGSAYVNFGYFDGQYLMGRYTEQSPDIPCTVNETVCTLEEFTRIYPLNETEYSDYLSGVLKEKANLIHNGSEWVIQLNSGEEIKVDSTFDFSQFAW